MYEPSDQYDMLQGLGLSSRVAEAVDRLYQDKIVPHLDDSIIAQLKSLPNEQVTLQAITQLRQSDLTTVINRATFFLGIIRSMKSKMGQPQQPEYEMGYSMVQQQRPRPEPSKRGPDEAVLKGIISRTGYSHEVTPSTRKYGGPPPNWNGPRPSSGNELFIGRLPIDVFEDDLIPVFEKYGRLFELRVITDSEGLNRGYGFVTYCDREDAKKAIIALNNYEIQPKRRIIVKLSVQFTRLFLGGIPKTKTADDVKNALSAEVEKLTSVILQPSDSGEADVHNRGFCFLCFDSYFDAAAARKKLLNGRTTIKAWDNYNRFKVDWAVPLENPDEEVASSTKTLLVNHLSDSVTQADLQEKFGHFGDLIKVTKKGHYAFITFAKRECALEALKLNQDYLKDAHMEVTLHVPLTMVAKRMVQIIKGTPPQPRGTGYKRGYFPRGMGHAGTFTRARIAGPLPAYGGYRGGFRGGRGGRGGQSRGGGNFASDYMGDGYNQFGGHFAYPSSNYSYWGPNTAFKQF